MKRIQSKLALTLSILISIQFFCFALPAGAHAASEMVSHNEQESIDCCDSQQEECRLEEISFADNNANYLKVFLHKVNRVAFDEAILKQPKNIYYKAFDFQNRTLKEISTIRLLI